MFFVRLYMGGVSLAGWWGVRGLIMIIVSTKSYLISGISSDTVGGSKEPKVE